MHNFLLRYYLAEHGLNPDRDIQIRVTPPAEMIANLRAGNIDGFLGPDPFNQRAVYEEVGFIHILSKDIWDGHPCCAFGTSQAFIQQNPNTFAALYRTILKSANLANQPENLMNISKVISKPNYLNQPEIVVRQTLTGRFADGLGNVIYQPNRAGFDPMPWDSMAIWILTQMKRWGYLKANVNYQDIAKQIFLMTDAEKQMKELGVFHPNEYQKRKKIIVMGKVFDPTQPDAYINSFKIKRTS
jgi:nitrate/nitrite transport system substrate-binding protein